MDNVMRRCHSEHCSDVGNEHLKKEILHIKMLMTLFKKKIFVCFMASRINSLKCAGVFAANHQLK